MHSSRSKKPDPSWTEVSIRRLENGREVERKTDAVAVEEPLEIRLGGEALVTLMRTPGDDRELIAGFLASEGLIKTRAQIATMEPCPHPSSERPGNIYNVTLAVSPPVDLAGLRRHFVASSSCGVCSKASIASVRQAFPRISTEVSVPASVIANLPDRLRAAQETFARTGGLHASAAFDVHGNLLWLREDVGRHNALDKLIGARLLKEGSLGDADILLVSGRVAFEIVQKALAGRFAVIAAISAPTSLAVEFAEENRQTLIGFLRDGRMNIYTHPQRVARLA